MRLLALICLRRASRSVIGVRLVQKNRLRFRRQFSSVIICFSISFSEYDLVCKVRSFCLMPCQLR